MSTSSEILISQVLPSDFLKKRLRLTAEDMVKNGKLDPISLTFRFPSSGTMEVKLSTVYVYLLGEVGEIVDNLNFVISDLSILPKMRSMTRREKMSRVRFLVRIYFYEYGRIKDVFAQYFSALRALKQISKSESREILASINQMFKKMVTARNFLTHGITELSRDEAKLRILAGGEIFGRRRANSRGEFIKFDELFVKLTRKYIVSMRTAGNYLVALVQAIVDTFEQIFELIDSDDSRAS